MQTAWRFTATFFLLALLMPLPGCDKRVAEVTASFNRFADALTERNGRVAAAHLRLRG